MVNLIITLIALFLFIYFINNRVINKIKFDDFIVTFKLKTIAIDGKIIKISLYNEKTKIKVSKLFTPLEFSKWTIDNTIKALIFDYNDSYENDCRRKENRKKRKERKINAIKNIKSYEGVEH